MGAVFAAYWYIVDSENDATDARQFAVTRLAPSPERDALLEQLSGASPSSAPGAGEFSPVGYRILSEPSTAEIEIELLLRPSDATKADLGMRIFMVWAESDWLLDASRPTDFPDVASYQTVPSDFVLWSSSEDSANTPGTLNRPAPGFATTSAPAESAAAGPECLLVPAKCLVDAVIDKTPEAIEKGKSAVTDFSAGLADSAFGRIAAEAVKAAEWSLETLLTSWLKYPDPKVADCYGGNASCAGSSTSVDTWVQANLHWLVLFAMVASVMIGALRIALTGSFDHGRDTAAALAKTVIVAFAGGTIIVTALEASDIFAEWILAQVDVDLTSGMGMAAFEVAAGNPVLLLILALIIVLTQLIQVALMVVRSGMVIMLAGILPLAASMGNTQTGKAWFTKAVGWLTAWILYKPVAALVYALAIKMTNSDQDAATQLSGMFMMVLAVLALPALMKFLVPAVSAAAGGNSGAVAGAMVGGAIATGAVVATGGMSAVAAGGGFAGASSAGQLGGATGGGSGGISVAPAGAGPSGSGSGADSPSSVIDDPSGGEGSSGSHTPPGAPQPTGSSGSAPGSTGSSSSPRPGGAMSAGPGGGGPTTPPPPQVNAPSPGATSGATSGASNVAPAINAGVQAANHTIDSASGAVEKERQG